jgi:MutS domain V
MSQSTNEQQQILQSFRQNIERALILIRHLKKNKTILAIARLLIVVVGIGSGWYFWGNSLPVVLAILLSGIIFIFLIFRDADTTRAIQNNERLIKINNHELDTINYEFNLPGYDNGQAFADASHAFASDLDLFGPSSLFQWMNRCYADQSRKLLAGQLKTALPVRTVKERQAAAKELSGKQAWCQQFQSNSMARPLTDKTENILHNWMASPSAGFTKSFWSWFQNLYPVFPISLLIFYIQDIITANSFLLGVGALFTFQFLSSRKTINEFALLSHIEPEMDTVYNQLHWIEKETFKSDFLLTLQNRLRPLGYASASASIKDLNRILKKIDWRSNLLMYPLLQLFLFWDLRLILLLNKWKRTNKNHLSEWIGAAAETEVSISLASLVYNNPGWCFPEPDEDHFHFQAKEIGHPLIPPSERVSNDITLEGTGKIILITGSNMAGKSTFLRSLGVNTVLAGMGAPVCARDLKLSHPLLVSSMRVADNLAENTSTFYAELKKLKYIIELVGREENIFILLDEVLRGTNSDDRHKGSQALVQQLLRTKAVAVMATHDTELAHSESADPSVSNYHFDGNIINDELSFDYKIKKGICESLNATTLMKKIGIHFQD